MCCARFSEMIFKKQEKVDEKTNKMRKFLIKQIISESELDWNNPNCLDTRYLEYLVRMYNERMRCISGYSMVNINNYMANSIKFNDLRSLKEEKMFNGSSINKIINFYKDVCNLASFFIDIDKFKQMEFGYKDEVIYPTSNKVYRIYVKTTNVFIDVPEIMSSKVGFSVSYYNKLLKNMYDIMTKCKYLSYQPNIFAPSYAVERRSNITDKELNNHINPDVFYFGNLGEIDNENSTKYTSYSNTGAFAFFYRALKNWKITTATYVKDESGEKQIVDADTSMANSYNVWYASWVNKWKLQILFGNFFKENTKLDIYAIPFLYGNNMVNRLYLTKIIQIIYIKFIR